MENKINSKTIIIGVIATLVIISICVVCLAAAAALWLHYGQPASPTGQAQLPASTATVGPTAVPVVDLTGIWQRGPSLAAGWDDRYHFYPSGSFHFYPNEMVCVEEKTERIGTWVVEGSLLTLKTTKQAIVHFEAIGSTALCRASGREEVALEEPLVEQYTLVDRGTAEGEPYPSVSIGGVTYWKFSDDASSYGDDEYPE